MTSLDYGPVEPVNRPGTMIVFFHCKNVRLHGITLRQSPNWTLHLQDVEGAKISDIQILNDPKVPNNDGIDCMKCRNVEITNCTIDTGDDGFAIVGSEYVNVSNCSIASRSAAIRLESTTLSTFRSLTMDTNRSIAIFANGYVGQENRPTEDITFSDIVIRTHLIPGGWWGKAESIYIAVQPCVKDVPCGVRVRNVVFNDITADAEGGVLLWGGEGTPITGVEFNGVRLHMIPPAPSLSESVGGNLDLRWTATSPRSGMIKSDIPAFYAKHVVGLRVRDVQVDWAKSMPEYFSDGMRVIDFSDLTLDDFAGRQAQDVTGSAISLVDGAGVAITNSRATPGTQTFLQLDKVSGRRVFVNDNLCSAAKVIAPADQRFDTQIGLPKGWYLASRYLRTLNKGQPTRLAFYISWVRPLIPARGGDRGLGSRIRGRGLQFVKWGSCLSAVASIGSGRGHNQSASGRAISRNMAGVPGVVWKGIVLHGLSGAVAMESGVPLPSMRRGQGMASCRWPLVLRRL